MKEECVFPDYNNSIVNLINTILKYYNVDTKYNSLPKLEEKLKQKNYKNIVLIVLDGMGEHIIKNISPDGFFMKNHLDKITSTSPSTTTAAMTTYYSGNPPIKTGWIAMSQYFKEYGRSLEMMRKFDSYTGKKYEDAKIDVFDLIKYETIYEKIEKASPDVKAYEINPGFCDARSKRNINADNMKLMCEDIESICSNKERNFILVYNDKPDTILHKFGCNSKEVKEFVLSSQNEIENMCNKLNNDETLVIISADHGHIDIEKTYYALELEEIQDCLIMPPSLESRYVTFWVKEEKKQIFEKMFKEKFEDEFLLLTKKELLEKNLLGIGEKHKKIDDFIGDYVAIATGNSIIKLGTYISKEKKNKKSTHCGLTTKEMEVPLIVI